MRGTPRDLSIGLTRIGLAFAVVASLFAASCVAASSGEVTSVRARPTEPVSRLMSSSSTPLLDRVTLEPVDDPRDKFPTVGLPPFGLYSATGSPRSVVESYLGTELDEATISTEPATSWLVPGVNKPFGLVGWTARRASGEMGRGVALVYESGEATSVLEVSADGIELGGLSAGAVGENLTVSGYVGLADATPFTVQVEDANNPDRQGATNVAQSDGRSALIEASASIDDVLVTRVRADGRDAPSFSALITGNERVGTQPLSFIDRLRIGAAGFMFDPGDNSPSQSPEDAAVQGVPIEVSELPLFRRVTPVGRASGGNYQAPLEGTLRWTMSRLPNSVGGGAELLLVEGGVDSPAAIRYAIELGAYRPSWVVATETHVYAGRKAESEDNAMVIRANLDGTDVAAVAQTQDPGELPEGWSAATPEQVTAIEEQLNFAPDPDAVDMIIDGDE